MAFLASIVAKICFCRTFIESLKTMIKEVNLVQKLEYERRRKVGDRSLEKYLADVFSGLDLQRQNISARVENSQGEAINLLDPNQLSAARIFHINQIKTICINYRLRFLDAKFFKGDLPAQAISEIRHIESSHQIDLKGFKIMAPSKLFVLKKTDDPLLFVPIANDYYYLICKWGNDLHPLRKLLAWPTKNVGTISTSLFISCMLLTLMTASFIFNGQTKVVYVFMLFLFYFKFAVGFLLFYGISLGKNFNVYIWKSPNDKLS